MDHQPDTVLSDIFASLNIRVFTTILIYFLAFPLSVRLLVHVCSIETAGPRGTIFGRDVGPDCSSPIFWFSGS